MVLDPSRYLLNYSSVVPPVLPGSSLVPNTAQALAPIAQAAGQLGMQRRQQEYAMQMAEQQNQNRLQQIAAAQQARTAERDQMMQAEMAQQAQRREMLQPLVESQLGVRPGEGLQEGSLQMKANEVMKAKSKQLTDLIASDPKLGMQMLKEMGIDSESKAAEAAEFSRKLMSAPASERNVMIQNRAEKLASEGRDPSDTLQLLNMTPEQQDSVLKPVEAAAMSLKPTADMQNFMYGQQLKESDPEAYRTWLAQNKIQTKEEAELTREAKKLENKLARMKANELEEKVEAKQLANVRSVENAISENNRVVSMVDDLANDPSLEDAVGITQQFTGQLTQAGQNFRQKHEALIATEGFRKLLDLKSLGATFGALSENELRGIQKAAANLDLSQSAKEYNRNLNLLKDRLNGASRKQRTSLIEMKTKYGIPVEEEVAPVQTLTDDELLSKYLQ